MVASEPFATIPLDFTGFWTWFLLFTRFTALLYSLPGIGTEEVPMPVRVTLAIVISSVLTISGAMATLPIHLAEAGLMILTEFALGYLLGAIPLYIVGSLAVAGQVTAASIGLGQASMIDPSLGEHVSVLGRLQALMAVAIFLIVDGHHVVISAASDFTTHFGIGFFRPDANTAQLLVERFSHSFELAVVVSGPILVTILVTQFVLGLLTKFVPQVNVFIVSLPLTIGVGLFIAAYTLPSLGRQLIKEFSYTEEYEAALMRGD